MTFFLFSEPYTRGGFAYFARHDDNIIQRLNIKLLLYYGSSYLNAL